MQSRNLTPVLVGVLLRAVAAVAQAAAIVDEFSLPGTAQGVNAYAYPPHLTQTGVDAGVPGQLRYLYHYFANGTWSNMVSGNGQPRPAAWARCK